MQQPLQYNQFVSLFCIFVPMKNVELQLNYFKSIKICQGLLSFVTSNINRRLNVCFVLQIFNFNTMIQLLSLEEVKNHLISQIVC